MSDGIIQKVLEPYLIKWHEIVIERRQEDSDSEMVNSFYYPIKDKEMCDKCIEKIENEKRLLLE